MVRRKLGKSTVIRGKGPLTGSLTNTSAGGAFVLTRFEIDTNLSTSWIQLGQTFTRWRIKSLTFHFATLKGSTTEGTVGICVLTDPLETSPGTTSTALGMQYSKIGNIHQNLSLRFKPLNKGWMFTRDVVGTTDDRLEMPGDVVYFTENTTAAYIPGVPWVTYCVEFCSVANSTVAPLYKSVAEKREANGMNSKMEEDTSGDNVNTCQEDDHSHQMTVVKVDDVSIALRQELSELKTKLKALSDMLCAAEL